MSIKPITMEDIQRMARGLGKDPATMKSLERQFREIMGSYGSDNRNQDELNELYKKIKEKFKHGFPLDIDIGEEDE
jgi:hypothetical protein